MSPGVINGSAANRTSRGATVTANRFDEVARLYMVVKYRFCFAGHLWASFGICDFRSESFNIHTATTGGVIAQVSEWALIFFE